MGVPWRSPVRRLSKSSAPISWYRRNKDMEWVSEARWCHFSGLGPLEGAGFPWAEDMQHMNERSTAAGGQDPVQIYMAEINRHQLYTIHGYKTPHAFLLNQIFPYVTACLFRTTVSWQMSRNVRPSRVKYVEVCNLEAGGLIGLLLVLLWII